MFTIEYTSISMTMTWKYWFSPKILYHKKTKTS